MTLQITITQKVIQDYDGNDETIKQAEVEVYCPACEIWKKTKEYFSYPNTTSDVDIETDVNTKMAERGYPID